MVLPPNFRISFVLVLEIVAWKKYRVHGDIDAQNWKEGDIVLIHGKVGKETIDSGKLERVPDTLGHKHVLIVVDPVRVFGNTN